MAPDGQKQKPLDQTGGARWQSAAETGETFARAPDVRYGSHANAIAEASLPDAEFVKVAGLPGTRAHQIRNAHRRCKLRIFQNPRVSKTNLNVHRPPTHAAKASARRTPRRSRARFVNVDGLVVPGNLSAVPGLKKWVDRRSACFHPDLETRIHACPKFGRLVLPHRPAPKA